MEDGKKQDVATQREPEGWNPYAAGALTGLLIVVSAAATGNYFGASSSFVRTAGLIERLFGPERVAALEYFQRFVPRIDWQWLFLAGIVLGSAASAATSGSFRLSAVPDLWARRFGTGRAPRALAAFAGGVVVMIGARIAGG